MHMSMHVFMHIFNLQLKLVASNVREDEIVSYAAALIEEVQRQIDDLDN